MRGLIVPILLIFLVAPGFSLTLEQAVKLARENNPQIAQAKASLAAAKAKIPQSLALDDPRLGLEYEQIPSGSRNLEDGMKMLTAEQMIMFPGKIFAEWQMSQAEASLQEASYTAKVLEITSQVKSAYYDLFYADRAIESLTDIADLLIAMKQAATAKYVTGMALQADVLLANIELLMTENELTTLQQEREIAAAKLRALLNQNDNPAIETELALTLPETIEAPAVLERQASQNRPELLAMKAELNMKDAAHLKSKMEYFPDTMLGVKKRVTDGWNAMLSFSVPLYFWKQGYNLSSAGSEREAASASYQNMKNMTRFEVKEAYVMADAGQRTLKLYQDKIVPQSAQAFKAAQAAYQSGKADFQVLLQIFRAYKEAKLKLYESQVKYGKALAELEKITGGKL